MIYYSPKQHGGLGVLQPRYLPRAAGQVTCHAHSIDFQLPGIGAFKVNLRVCCRPAGDGRVTCTTDVTGVSR